MEGLEGMVCFTLWLISLLSVGNSSKDLQGFVDACVFISASDWSNRLSTLKNVAERRFK